MSDEHLVAPNTKESTYRSDKSTGTTACIICYYYSFQLSWNLTTGLGKMWSIFSRGRPEFGTTKELVTADGSVKKACVEL